jgi:hypothetical protein
LLDFGDYMNFDSANPVDISEAVDVIECLHEDMQSALLLLKNNQMGVEDFKSEILECAKGIIQNLEYVK